MTKQLKGDTFDTVLHVSTRLVFELVKAAQCREKNRKEIRKDAACEEVSFRDIKSYNNVFK